MRSPSFVPGNWWLRQVVINGDTSGRDVGNCTADDAYITVRLNPLYVWYN
jgi:hypothetical protein